MKKLLCGLAALPFLTSVALAGQPTPLSDKQMDTVTAGWDLYEVDCSNTSVVVVSVYQRPSNSIGCPGCYLNINSSAISVAAAFR
jgi:hypothetical protein